MFGVCMEGLFHETSFQPRSSARITMRWGGGGELTPEMGENKALELFTNMYGFKCVNNIVTLSMWIEIK